MLGQGPSIDAFFDGWKHDNMYHTGTHTRHLVRQHLLHQARKIQSLDRLDHNPAGLKDRRKPHLEGQIGASIDGGLALLVAASLKRLQDEREAGWAVNADAVEGGGGGLFSGGGGGGASGSGGGQEKQAASASAAAPMSSGFTLDQLHTELHQLLAVKVCVCHGSVCSLFVASIGRATRS